MLTADGRRVKEGKQHFKSTFSLHLVLVHVNGLPY